MLDLRRSFFLALFLLSGLILPGSLKANEFSKISDISVSRIPPGIINLIDATPVATPVASPESSPVVTPKEPTLDANDYLDLTYAQKLKLNINGLIAKDIRGEATLVFSLKTSSGTTEPTLGFTIYSKAAGQYDLRFPEFDDKTLDLQLKVTDIAGERSYSLPSASRILFQATTFEGLIFDGTGTVPPGTLPKEKIEFPAGIFTNVIAEPGQFTIRAKGDGSTPPEPSPEPTPGPKQTPNPNPNPNPNPGPSNGNGSANDTPLSPPIGAVGQLGGGGGRFGCSLSLMGANDGLAALWLSLVPGFLVALRARKS